MKLVIVGVGGMGGAHFNIHKNAKNYELAAACDIRLDMLKEKAGDLPIRLYSDYEEMLAKEKPDVVDVCTPTYLHAEMAIKAMEAGAHVLSEKPMALNSSECEAILACVKRTGKHYMTAQVVRFMNAYSYLRQTIESGRYGKLESLSMQRYSATPRWSWDNWFQDKARSGHVALDMMIHDVDYVQSVLGMPDVIHGVYHEMKGNLSNYGFVNYLYDNSVVSIETGWYNTSIPFSATFKAVFADGWLILKDGVLNDCGKTVDFADAEKIGETGINISNVDGYAGEIAYFIDCIRKEEENSFVTPESSAATIALVERTLNALTRIN